MMLVDILFSVFVLAEAWTAVCFKRVAISLVEHPFTLALLTPTLGLPVYGALAGWTRFRLHGIRMAPLAVGMLYAVHNVLEKVANRGNTLPGPFVAMVSQVKIPVTIVILTIRNKSLPPARQLIAASIVLTGAILTMTMRMHLLRTAWYNVVLLIAAAIPYSVGVLVLESALKDKPWGAVPTCMLALCTMEFVATLIMAPVSAALQGIRAAETFSNLWTGLIVLCSPETTDTPIWWYLAGLPTAFAFNMCIVFGLRSLTPGSASATYLWLMYALAMPIGYALFSAPALMGPYALEVQWSDFVGMLIIVAGILLYRGFKIPQWQCHYNPCSRSADRVAVSLPLSVACNEPTSDVGPPAIVDTP